MYRHLFATLAFIATMGFTGQAAALTTPYTETFIDGLSGWTTGANPNQIVASGGADGGSYLSTTASPTASAFGAVSVLFRCESAACSDGAFQGDWRDDLVLSWYFRHDADIALQAYARIAAPSNNPGASAIVSTWVQPNTWTRIDLVIDPSNPAFTSFSGQSFDAVFDEVGRVQLGISLPAGFSGSNLHFDLDSVSISTVPEPESYALMAAGLLLMGVVSRRKQK
ncbi:PEP-CTERM sorting domain-containing protein [Methylophilus sp. QUAN]|uniref:PEP-CTERM sorting domain-containing protein n=1 Tax=Methylophilus sp. QUAN TaxID=2781020 RepID=UPI00188F3D3F|nr:PEP-CTERM sorting domain-containing protein [Methylophilus sp. QUAN]MBF4992099.1 PEP-CTERM sorting domain-containing protein [Methylophilus sp. QUAN]